MTAFDRVRLRDGSTFFAQKTRWDQVGMGAFGHWEGQSTDEPIHSLFVPWTSIEWIEYAGSKGNPVGAYPPFPDAVRSADDGAGQCEEEAPW